MFRTLLSLFLQCKVHVVAGQHSVELQKVRVAADRRALVAIAYRLNVTERNVPSQKCKVQQTAKNTKKLDRQLVANRHVAIPFGTATKSESAAESQEIVKIRGKFGVFKIRGKFGENSALKIRNTLW